MKSIQKHGHFKFNTNAIIYLVLVSLIFLSLFFSSCSDDSDPLPDKEPTLAESLQNALDEGLEKYNGIGISAAVFLPDGEKWAGASGVSHGILPITTTMPFGAGSITKNFTAATIIKLAEDGKLNLDDSLHSWLPSYPKFIRICSLIHMVFHTPMPPKENFKPEQPMAGLILITMAAMRISTPGPGQRLPVAYAEKFFPVQKTLPNGLKPCTMINLSLVSLVLIKCLLFIHPAQVRNFSRLVTVWEHSSSIPI
jgi:hypothetical protein